MDQQKVLTKESEYFVYRGEDCMYLLTEKIKKIKDSMKFPKFS